MILSQFYERMQLFGLVHVYKGKNVLFMKKLIVIMALACFGVTESHAQKEKKVVRKYKVEEKVSPDNPEKKMIRIERNVDGKVEVTEEEVDIKAPRARVYAFHSAGEADTLREKELKYGEGFSWEEDFPRLSDRYRRNLDGFRLNMEDLAERVNRDFGGFRWDYAAASEGFSNVHVFTNKPATHILNLRFKSSEQGPVSISVVDPQGERVASEYVEDFSGEYIGQLNLQEGSKGTFFVILSQGEKAVSRKVKVE